LQAIKATKIRED